MTWSRVCLLLSIAIYPSSAGFLEPKASSRTIQEHSVAASDSKKPFNTTNGTVSAARSVAVQPSLPIERSLVHTANGTSYHTTNSSSQAWGIGVVHFLFLVNDNIPHADIWRSFFSNAIQGSWKVLVHCKDPAGCERNGVFSKNPGFIKVETTPTWYCHDLVTAMVQLAASALRLNAALLGGREKFVYLSESALPIKPFAEIHNTLLLDDSSDFCLFPSDQWGSASIDGSFVKLIKHHQWVVLSRAHAEMLVRDWVPVNAKSEWKIQLKTGTWQGHARNVQPQNFYYPASANTCTDEWAFMATIFGALEPMGGARYLPGFGGGHVNMDTHTTQGRCRTWTYWDNSWDPDTTALGSQIANDFYGSKMSCYPKCGARPASLEKLSQSSLRALRQSPFLFARKFSPTMWMPHYYSIVLA